MAAFTERLQSKIDNFIKKKLRENRHWPLVDSFSFLSLQILGVVFAICLFRSIGYEKI